MRISKELYERVVECTSTDYEPYTNESDFVMIDDPSQILNDLLYEIGMRDEKIEDMQNDINENYIPVKTDPYDEYGVSKYDF